MISSESIYETKGPKLIPHEISTDSPTLLGPRHDLSLELNPPRRADAWIAGSLAILVGGFKPSENISQLG